MKDSREDKRIARESEGKWHAAYQNAWKRNPTRTLISVLGSVRASESPVALDGRLGVRSSPQHSQ